MFVLDEEQRPEGGQELLLEKVKGESEKYGNYCWRLLRNGLYDE